MWTQKLVPDNDRTDDGPTWGQDFVAGKIGIMPGGYGQVEDLATPAQLGHRVRGRPAARRDRRVQHVRRRRRLRHSRGGQEPVRRREFITWVLQTQQQEQYPGLGAHADPHDLLTPGPWLRTRSTRWP